MTRSRRFLFLSNKYLVSHESHSPSARRSIPVRPSWLQKQHPEASTTYTPPSVPSDLAPKLFASFDGLHVGDDCSVQAQKVTDAARLYSKSYIPGTQWQVVRASLVTRGPHGLHVLIQYKMTYHAPSDVVRTYDGLVKAFPDAYIPHEGVDRLARFEQSSHDIVTVIFLSDKWYGDGITVTWKPWGRIPTLEKPDLELAAFSDYVTQNKIAPGLARLDASYAEKMSTQQLMAKYREYRADSGIPVGLGNQHLLAPQGESYY